MWDSKVAQWGIYSKTMTFSTPPWKNCIYSPLSGKDEVLSDWTKGLKRFAYLHNTTETRWQCSIHCVEIIIFRVAKKKGKSFTWEIISPNFEFITAFVWRAQQPDKLWPYNYTVWHSSFDHHPVGKCLPNPTFLYGVDCILQVCHNSVSSERVKKKNLFQCH